MRMSELSERTEVPVATIKYYLREGLLPDGERITPRLTEYDDRHVRQLRLLRILREVGHVPVERLRGLIAAAGSGEETIHELFAEASDALSPTPPEPDEAHEMARLVVDDIVAQAGWTHTRANSPDRDLLAATLATVIRHDTHPGGPEDLVPYVEAADRIARYELGRLDDAKDRQGLLEEMVVGRVTFGEVLASLRRLAQEHYSYERFGEDHRG